jgi:hypothetical protein
LEVERSIAEAIGRAEQFLVERQAPDGFWRDYWLYPGQSEDWTTACVGWALACAPRRDGARAALVRSANALRWAWRPGGWGYNRDTDTDADSTSWVSRFLAAVLGRRGPNAVTCLTRYLDCNGNAHTFMPVEQAGRWADAHADVTPLVGLALLSVGADRAWIARIRGAVEATRQGAGVWSSFWWDGASYATARSLEFLRASGGIPDDAARAVRGWLGSAAEPTPFEMAQRAECALLVGAGVDGVVEWLLDAQLQDGGWPSSPALRVPSKERIDSPAPRHEDNQRLFGTSMVLSVLKKRLRVFRSNRSGASGL